MLSNPKWLLFALIFFGGITIFGGIVDGLMYTPDASVVTNINWINPIDTVQGIGSVLTWDYDWIPSSFALLRYILAVFSGVFILLLAYEALVAVRNFFRIL